MSGHYIMKTMLFLLVSIVLLFRPCISGDMDVGFDLFFKSNTAEMKDIPIYFEKPLPSWLKGTLIRNGLGRFEMGKRTFLHTFDAFGKLSSWRFPGNGTASFSTRFISSKFYNASLSSNDIAPFLMFEGVEPKYNELEKVEALVRGIDNMNVNVYETYDVTSGKYDYIVLNDFWKVYKINPYTLETIESFTAKVPKKKEVASRFDFLSFLSSAHPLPEHSTGHHFTYVSTVSVIPGIPNTITLVRLKSLAKRELVAQWTVEKVPYMHSFAVTKQYVIFFASPFYVNTMKMVESASPIDSLDWFQNENTTLYVVHVDSGNVTSIKTENMFSMHFVNAFETDNGKIVVDVSTYPNPDFVRSLEISVLLDPIKRNSFDAHALLKRFTIDVSSRTVSQSLFEPSPLVPYASKIDMPVINEHFRYRQYCYVYGVVLKADEQELSYIAVAKKNLCGEPEKDRTWISKGHYPVEPWFVPSVNGTDEDDGVLMVPVLDGGQKKSYLAILDARTMKIVNKAYLPTVVPYNLHGRFFDNVS